MSPKKASESASQILRFSDSQILFGAILFLMML